MCPAPPEGLLEGVVTTPIRKPIKWAVTRNQRAISTHQSSVVSPTGNASIPAPSKITPFGVGCAAPAHALAISTCHPADENCDKALKTGVVRGFFAIGLAELVEDNDASDADVVITNPTHCLTTIKSRPC